MRRDLFTPRQLVALTTFSDLVGEARDRVLADGGDESYADAVATYLAFAVDKAADRNTSLCTWDKRNESHAEHLRSAGDPDGWDFAEGEPVLDGCRR